jgi:hypothetical protein
MNSKLIEDVARHCVDFAIEEVEKHYIDEEKPRAMPKNPLEGDWDFLAEQLGRAATDEEEIEFERCYREMALIYLDDE